MTLPAGCGGLLTSYDYHYDSMRERALDTAGTTPEDILIWNDFPAWETEQEHHLAPEAPENHCLLTQVRRSRCPSEGPPVTVLGRISLSGDGRATCDPNTFECALSRPPEFETLIGSFREIAHRHGGKGLVFTESILDYGPEEVLSSSTARASVTAYVISWDSSDQAWRDYCRENPDFEACLTGS